MTSPSKTATEIAADEYANQTAPYDVAMSMVVSEIFLAGAQWALTHSPEVQGLREALAKIAFNDFGVAPIEVARRALAAFDVATRGMR